MPLQLGSSQSAVSANISELMSSFHDKGSIGTSHPASDAKAQRQAIAIALDKARRARRGKRKSPRERVLEKKAAKEESKA